MKSWSLLTAGIVIGIAFSVIAYLLGWIPLSDPPRPEPWNDAAHVDRARVVEFESADNPVVDIVHGDALEAAGAVEVGMRSADEGAGSFGCEAIETNSLMRAFFVWLGDGLTGSAAVLRFGPNRDEVGLRVSSYTDTGRNATWRNVHASIRLSDWPVDRPGTIVAFEIEGELDGKVHAFDGKFRVPGTR